MKAKKQPPIAPIQMSRPKPIVPRTLVALFATCIGFLVLYFALLSVLHTPSIYTQLRNESMAHDNAAVLDYLRGPIGTASDTQSLSFLDESERAHMQDVKHLFDVAYIVAVCAIGIIIGILTVFMYNKMWHRLDELLGRSLRGAGWTILAICFVIGAASLLNFDKLWLLFHAILFPQGNWMFAYNSAIITLYPGDFFERFILRWAMLVISFGICAVVISYVMEHMRHAERTFTAHYEMRNGRTDKTNKRDNHRDNTRERERKKDTTKKER